MRLSFSFGLRMALAALVMLFIVPASQRSSRSGSAS